jgi:3',5'-nucleoside bisphosphate phosphatase
MAVRLRSLRARQYKQGRKVASHVPRSRRPDVRVLTSGCGRYGPPVPTLPNFDLQSHSQCSDGSLEPAQVVAAAAEAGVELLALTDHDTVDGVAEAMEAGREHGIGVVSGVEISAVRGPNLDVHVLGYGFEPGHPALAEALARFRAERELRNDRIVDRLRDLGLRVDLEEVERRRESGRPVGRPHLARAVLAEPENAQRLAAEGADTVDGMFRVYLADGGPGWVPRESPTVPEAIEVVHAAGGVAVWAHPFFDVTSREEVLAEIDRFHAHGLDGVECFYVTYSRDQVELLCDHCEAHGLLRTGSADFHGPDRPSFNRFRAFDLHGREPELGPIAAAPPG